MILYLVILMEMSLCVCVSHEIVPIKDQCSRQMAHLPVCILRDHFSAFSWVLLLSDVSGPLLKKML